MGQEETGQPRQKVAQIIVAEGRGCLCDAAGRGGLQRKQGGGGLSADILVHLKCYD